MVYEVDYAAAEREGCSSKIIVDDRIFFVKLLASPADAAKYFSGDQGGHVQKEISRAEFELWLNILADDEAAVKAILEKVCLGKKY
jgi:hypothetical protein